MGISRRDFLKIGIAGVSGLYLVPAFDRPGPPGKGAEGRMRVIPTFCTICSAHCGIWGVLEGDRLVSIEGNQDFPNNRGGLCTRGIAAINQVYDPERLLYPLKRVGKRGEGKWQQISWDEAFWELSTRMVDTARKENSEGIIFDLGFPEPLIVRFINSLGSAKYIEREALALVNCEEGHRLFWGKGRGVPDLAQSKYVLNFGANPYETGEDYVGTIARLIKGRENGAKLITFDPRLSYTAGKSDKWYPIKPGTDGALALALAQSIVTQGLHNRTFLEGWTDLRSDELSLLSPLTPEWAEGITGVKAADIKKVASEFARNSPSTVIVGGGVSQRKHGVQTTSAILLLNALVGNIDKEGGYLAPEEVRWEDPLPSPPERGKRATLSLYSTLKERKRRPGLIFLYRADPLHVNPGGMGIEDLLHDEITVSYLVAMDVHMTKSASLADLVLPAALPLESWGLTTGVTPEGKRFLSLRQPVVHTVGEPALLRPKELSTRRENEFPFRMTPLGEALPFSELCIELAHRLGGRVHEYFPFKSTEEYISQFLTRIPSLRDRGGLSYLKKRGIFILPERQAYLLQKEGFPTPSGKLHISLADLVRAEPWQHGRPTSGSDYQLVIFTKNVSSERVPNSKWIAEIAHHNPLWIHTTTAKKLMINEGGHVRVKSKAGEMEVDVRITQGIRPEVVALAKDFTLQGSRIAPGKKFKSPDPDTNLLWWGEEVGLGVNPQLLLGDEHDPLGGGMVLAGTEVEIGKIGGKE